MKWLYWHLPGGEFIWNRFHKHDWEYHQSDPEWSDEVEHRYCQTCHTHQEYIDRQYGSLETTKVEWKWRTNYYCNGDKVGKWFW